MGGHTDGWMDGHHVFFKTILTKQPFLTYRLFNLRVYFKLEIVFMKHCDPNHIFIHKDDLNR